MPKSKVLNIDAILDTSITIGEQALFIRRMWNAILDELTTAEKARLAQKENYYAELIGANPEEAAQLLTILAYDSMAKEK